MAAKVSAEMHLALKFYAQGQRIPDAARRAGVTVRGLRYALSRRKKTQLVIDKRK